MMKLRQETKPEPLPLVEAIRAILMEFGELIPRPFESPYQHIRRMSGVPKRGQVKQWQYKRAVKQLANRKEIIISKENGKLFLRLTKKGKVLALLRKLNKVKEKKWDGKWRLMIWDIPETSRKQRDAIRRFVKKLGFYRFQKSVFIVPYELPGDAVRYLEESGLIKFVRFLRVDKLDNDTELKKHFGL